MSVRESTAYCETHVTLRLSELRVLCLQHDQTVLEVDDLVVEVRGLSLLEYISSVLAHQTSTPQLTS